MSLQKRIKWGFLQFVDIKSELNGFGRIIYYTTNDPERRADTCALVKIQEGKFVNGLPNGYCRIINCAGDGSVEIGYFKDNWPDAEYLKFNLDGECIQDGLTKNVTKATSPV